jgi:putative ABC transport system permease protein
VSTVLLAPGMMLFLGGCVLVLPAVLSPLLPVTRFLLRPVFGPEGSIALRQLERQHTRTSLTVGVLFIGVIVTIGFGSALLNNIHDIDVWYRSTVAADMLVRGSMPDGGTIWASPISRELREEIKRQPGVDPDAVGRITFTPVQVGGQSAILLARDYPEGRPLSLALVEGSEAQVRAGLRAGGAVLGSPLAHRLRVGLGDEVTLKTREGERRVRVAGVVKEYTVGGMALYMSWDTADGLFKLPGVSSYEVYALRGQEELALKNVKELGRQKGLLVQSNVQVRQVVDGIVASVEGFLWVLIALMFVVAALGIVNTLTMNVIEQTRELGVLRAIGLKRGQVRKLVIAQAVALGLLSVLPGVLAGLGLSWLMNEATYPFSGHRVAFTWRPGFVAGCAAAALAVAVLASLLPARRAARLRIIEALHYE